MDDYYWLSQADWQTQLYFGRRVHFVLDPRNAVPAFRPPAEGNEEEN